MEYLARRLRRVSPVLVEVGREDVLQALFVGAGACVRADGEYAAFSWALRCRGLQAVVARGHDDPDLLEFVHELLDFVWGFLAADLGCVVNRRLRRDRFDFHLYSGEGCVQEYPDLFVAAWASVHRLGVEEYPFSLVEVDVAGSSIVGGVLESLR